MAIESTAQHRWPVLPVAEWQDTRDTLQLYTQVVSKIRAQIDQQQLLTS